MEHLSSDLCPHRSVLELPEVGLPEQAKDQLKLICLQAQLGYVLLGLMGDKRLRNYGYPHQSVKKSFTSFNEKCMVLIC